MVYSYPLYQHYFATITTWWYYTFMVTLHYVVYYRVDNTLINYLVLWLNLVLQFSIYLAIRLLFIRPSGFGLLDPPQFGWTNYYVFPKWNFVLKKVGNPGTVFCCQCAFLRGLDPCIVHCIDRYFKTFCLLERRESLCMQSIFYKARHSEDSGSGEK